MRVAVFQIIMGACCLYALLRGGRSERAAAAGYLIAAILTAVAVRPHAHLRFHGSILAIDSALYLLFAAIALRSTRYWPLWLTWLQGADVVCQLAMWYSPALSVLLYWGVVAPWGYLMLLLIAAATWRRSHDRYF